MFAEPHSLLRSALAGAGTAGCSDLSVFFSFLLCEVCAKDEGRARDQ